MWSDRRVVIDRLFAESHILNRPSPLVSYEFDKSIDPKPTHAMSFPVLGCPQSSSLFLVEGSLPVSKLQVEALTCTGKSPMTWRLAIDSGKSSKLGLNVAAKIAYGEEISEVLDAWIRFKLEIGRAHV